MIYTVAAVGVQCVTDKVMLTKEKQNRETRFSIRATRKEREIITRAAARLNKSVSEFVLENALETAEALELDDAHFVVSRERYEAFLAALDEPGKPVPALKKLFSEPDIFDGSENRA